MNIRSGSSAQHKEGKLWDSLEELPVKDWNDFTTLFSRQVVEKKLPKKVEEKPVKHQSAKILDSKRSQNVGILIKSMNIDIDTVKHGELES